ncbi:MAG: phospholipid/cholesterol/gamma-HCH transport system substrate-binding protein [Solirubrobacteraceae bacterium]|nr:phospholipid/cholesterol/gamma-HCH transport system substrate-binding protein [Solirubrobacteraceae bacterium]
MKRGTIPPSRFWGVIAVASAIALAAVAFIGGDTTQGHTLVLTVPEANAVIPGQQVTAGGEVIGRVNDVKALNGGRAAELDLGISTGHWPIPQGSTFDIRWGGTVASLNRRVQVTMGAKDAPPYTDRARVPESDVSVPAEFDQIIDTFDAKSRQGVKDALDNTGPALKASEPGLEGTLTNGPGAVEEVAYVLRDLTADRAALDTALKSTSNVVAAINRSNPSFGQLLDGAAGTFDAVADSEANLKTTLSRLPAALDRVKEFSVPIDETLVHAGELTDKLGPGIQQLREIARPLDGVLASLRAIGPDAIATLRTAQANAPQITRLLDTVTTVSPRLTSTLNKLNPQLDCLRPYTPELNGLLMTWGDFLSYRDQTDRILRAQVQNFLPAGDNTIPYTPAEAKQLFPDLRYGFPRPPGYLAGQPWYRAKCGYGKSAVNPADDQEAKVYKGSDIPAGG